ncbi:MAG TPA: multiple cyclophane-containing RiPP AmcA [Micromonospora sp.]
MPETTGSRQAEHVGAANRDQFGAGRDGRVDERLRNNRAGLTTLLREAEEARRRRAEVASPKDDSVVCAWNHFENIPTFYNWNNRPR